MRISYLRSLGFVLFTCVPLVVIAADQASPAPDSAAPASATPSSLSSPAAADVVKLAQSGVTDDVLLAFVNSSQQLYNLSVNDILYLKNAGLPPAVLEAMLRHDSALAKSPSPGNSQQKSSAAGNPITPAPSQIISAGRPPQAGSPTARLSTSSPPAQVQGETVVNRRPPPARIEPVPPPPPGHDYVWTPGYWSWRNRAWVWVRGSWIIRPRSGALWVSGYWMRNDHTWVWVPGHW